MVAELQKNATCLLTLRMRSEPWWGGAMTTRAPALEFLHMSAITLLLQGNSQRRYTVLYHTPVRLPRGSWSQLGTTNMKVSQTGFDISDSLQVCSVIVIWFSKYLLVSFLLPLYTSGYGTGCTTTRDGQGITDDSR